MKSVKYILSLGFAAGLGLAAGLLFAPRSGKRTRARLAEELDDVKESIEDAGTKKIKEAKKKIHKSIEAQQEKSKEAVSRLKHAIKL
jgi:gas vesicle protein